MESTDEHTASEEGDVESLNETLNTTTDQQDAETEQKDGNDPDPDETIIDEKEIGDIETDHHDDVKDSSQETGHIDGLNNSAHSIDSEILAMQQNLGNVAPIVEPLDSDNDKNPRKTDKDVEGSEKFVSDSHSKVEQSETSSSRQPARKVIVTRSKKKNNNAPITKPSPTIPINKKKPKKEQSMPEPQPSTSGYSVGKVLDTKSAKKHSLSLKSRKMIAKSKEEKDQTDTSNVVKKKRKFDPDTVFIEISDDGREDELLEEQRNRPITPPAKIPKEKKKVKTKSSSTSKPVKEDDNVVDLNPPKSTKKRKTVAEVATEKAKELSEMNQRRVAALEKIGESCRIASSNKKNVDPTVLPIEPKKEVTVTNPPAVKDIPDDEIKMWGKIVERNIREIDSHILREDLMDHILMTVRRAKRGTWNPSGLLFTPPRIVQGTPSRPQSSMRQTGRPVPSLRQSLNPPAAAAGSLRSIREIDANEPTRGNDNIGQIGQHVIPSVTTSPLVENITEQVIQHQMATQPTHYTQESFAYAGGFFPCGTYETHPSYTTL